MKYVTIAAAILAASCLLNLTSSLDKKSDGCIDIVGKTKFRELISNKTALQMH